VASGRIPATVPPVPMFSNLIETFARRAAASDYEVAFVQEVTVRVRSPRDRRVERTIAIAWILIAIKCWLVSWAVAKYNIPLPAMWVNGPTVIFALVTTAVYYWRD